MMMFADIIKYVEEKEYQLAVDALPPLLKNEDEKIVAKAHHILGYINTRHDYTEKSDYQAKRHLRFNLNSNYPHPYGYVLYSQVEEDSNVALNYLEKGVARFPQDARILLEYFRLVPNKNAVIQIVKERNVNDARLLSAVIDYLVSVNQWNDVCHFAVQLENGNNLCESEQNYLDLIKAYADLFSDSPDYSEAQRLLEKVIRTDTDNNLAYSHYLGIIYANLKLGRVLEATEFFDRIPVSNAVTDLDEWAQPLWISISFETLYPIIFKSILSTFAQDSSRKVKANVLYCLYLYSPSESYDIHRYKKSDVATLTRYLKTDFNKKIAVAVYRMRCHFKQFEDAYDILWEFLVRHQDPEESEIYFSETLENMSDDEVCRIARKTIEYLENDEWTPKQFVPSVFGTLVERLHDIKQYDLNRGLAEYLPLADILKSGHAFECAYAYAEKEQPRATDIYEAIVKREPNNSSAINNLGVRYEHAGDLYKALDCYERAVTLAPNEKIHQNNLTRIKNLIYEKTEEEVCAISDAISVESLENIGYTDEFCRKLFLIHDNEMRDILQRDLRECAIAVVAGQDKAATIMCGSIIEALLMLKIKERGISKYDVSAVSKGKTNHPVSEMSLNELLYIADIENILDKNGYHLGHYIRDYRNVVHPAKEIRMSEEVNHENVITMWAVLKRLVSDLYT